MRQAASPISEQAIRLSLQLDRESRAAVRARLAQGTAGPVEFRRDQLENRGQLLREAGVHLMAADAADFPTLLADIPDPPLLLYAKGDGACAAGPAVAIVGARRASESGRRFARTLAGELAGMGLVIVSGLALGIDAAAHLGALDAGGRTVAVLGSGPERVTPLANAHLGERILADGGLILSEYPPGTPPVPFRFPERNRLISGLCLGVVVIEANERSGSLITARLAAEQGREVMAVPGLPGYPNSAGSNRLIKSGAALVERAEDVLHALGADGVPGRPCIPKPDTRGLTPVQLRLLDLLDGRAQSAEALAAELRLDSAACAVALTELELTGFVQRVSGGYIRRPSEF